MSRRKYNLQFFSEDKQKCEFRQSVDNQEVLEIYIYGYIEGDSYNWWTGEKIVSKTSADYFREELAKYQNLKQIILYVNSGGGSVMEAMGIRSQLKRHPAEVIGYVDGFACSAAAFILTGCDKVIMYSNTMQMVHDMYQYACGNYRELRKIADDLEAISMGNRTAWVEKAAGKVTEEQVAELLMAESWLTAKQCLEYGFCDEIVDEQKDLTQALEISQKENKTIEQQLKFHQSLLQLKQELMEPKGPQEPQIPPEQQKRNEMNQKTLSMCNAFMKAFNK